MARMTGLLSLLAAQSAINAKRKRKHTPPNSKLTHKHTNMQIIIKGVSFCKQVVMQYHKTCTNKLYSVNKENSDKGTMVHFGKSTQHRCKDAVI
eukprot:5711853-Amphidinium_carterae.1